MKILPKNLTNNGTLIRKSPSPPPPLLRQQATEMFHPNLDPSVTEPGPHQTLLIRRTFQDPSTSGLLDLYWLCHKFITVKCLVKITR